MKYPQTWLGFQIRRDLTWNKQLVAGALVEVVDLIRGRFAARVPGYVEHQDGERVLKHDGFTNDPWFWFDKHELEPLTPAAEAFFEAHAGASEAN